MTACFVLSPCDFQFVYKFDSYKRTENVGAGVDVDNVDHDGNGNDYDEDGDGDNTNDFINCR